MDVVDQIQPGDVVRRVRIWDGERTERALKIEKGATAAPFF